MKLKTILASWLVCALTACGGGGSGISTQAPPEPERITISGFVSDDPVVGASVKLSSLDGDRPLGTAVSGSGGAFSITTGKADLGTGYRLESSGGTMNGQPFADILKAIYPAAKATGSSNLTLITTALVGTANSTTAFNGTLLQKHESVLQDALKRGLLGLDYAAVEPAGRLMESLRQTSLVRGVANAVAALSETLDAFKASQSCVAGGTCNARLLVYPGQPTSLKVGPAEISWTDGTLNQCYLLASYNDAKQELIAKLENNTDQQGVALCNTTGLVRLSLPEILTSDAPDECLPQAKTAKPITHCVTVGSGIRPDFEVNAKSNRNSASAWHRHPNRFVDVAMDRGGETSSISRSYGAVLYSSLAPTTNSTGSAKDQWVGKTAVIFIHGFTSAFFDFGGKTGTWGNFPQLVSNDTSKVVLNFQWKTDTSFVRASRNLAKAVEYASLSTGGRKVHIIAHSFGGILARAFLQNLASDAPVGAASNLVATLVTVGTPHSGIASKSSGLFVDDSMSPQRFTSRNLPQGWDSTLPDTFCGQISCFEAGLSATVADWALTAMEPAHQRSPGYVPAMLADVSRFPLPSGLKVLSLIGAPSISNGFLSGDGLVTYRGQGFRPNDRDTPLLSNETVSFATVTERVLGLPAHLPAYPGSPNTLPSRSQYSLGKISNYVAGYRHIEGQFLVAGLQITRAIAFDAPHAEVYLDENDCDTSANCPHDTWILTRDFHNSNPAGCAAPKTLLDGVCVLPTTSTIPLSFTAWKLWIADAPPFYAPPAANVFEETGEGLKFYESVARGGAEIFTKSDYSFAGRTLYAKVKFNGGGTFGDAGIGISFSCAIEPCNAEHLVKLSTGNSYNGSTVIKDNVWYFVRSVISTTGYISVTATGNYDDQGGATVQTYQGYFAAYSNSGKPTIYFGDTYAPTVTTVLGELIIK